jgi:iron complex outermembrane receptor protein
MTSISRTRMTRVLRGVVALGTLTLAGGTVAVHAQEQQAQPAQPAEALQEVVVTGSLIKRTNAETAEAVTIISSNDLRNMGVTSTEQALQQIVANQPTLTTAAVVSSYSGGESEASLRSLGGSHTLVLLDGQRLANNVETGNAVDLNTIPFAAIDHIEVLREGASALYGTDAIAGVINFITKKNYDKGELNISWNEPSHDGGASGQGDVTWGKGNIVSDGYNVMFAANYSKQDELTAGQRSFAATGLDVGRGLVNQNGPFGTWPASFQDANNNLWQVGYPQCKGNPYLLTIQQDCAYLYSAVVDLIPWSDQWSGLMSLTKTLPGNNQISLQYFYSLFRVTAWFGPQTYSFEMSPTSPYYPTAAESTCSGGAGNCSTPAPALGGDILAAWTDPNNNRYSYNHNTEQRLLLTLSGSNWGWDYETALNLSQNHNEQGTSGGYANYALLAPGGILSNQINPFGPQSAAGQALINSAYLTGELAAGNMKMGSLNGHATHELGDAFGAGRAATIGLGFDARVEQMNFASTALAATLYTATFFPPSVIIGSRNAQAVYSELNVPVTKNFEFTLSDREDRYSDFGNTNNGKISARYQPASFLTFRGAASTGFRAPSLFDLYNPNTFGAVAGTMDGPPCPAGTPTGIFTHNVCISQGVGLSGGNTHLEPETSQNLDIGMVIEPIENLGVTIDYYRILIKNEIQVVAPQAIYANPTTFSGLYVLNNAGSLTAAPNLNTACSPTYTVPTCGYILQTLQNTGGITTGGFDLSAQYLLRTAIGKFRVGLEGTLITQYLFQEYQGGPQLNLVAQWNNGNQPVMRLRSLLTLDWESPTGIWGAGVSEQFTSSYKDEFPYPCCTDTTVASYSLWNGYVQWKPVAPLTVLFGVRNLFDTKPPFSNQTTYWQAGYNPVLSDALGRTFYARLKVDF